eukprot:CAMPEP_0182462582 /NCGR_PEP_ID=MMETSP1319-20130603/6795_1 /TAXON_ID=172717 /ORGANISM="Bolidomonas pacifica, Strain RCC208" /LENGTH=113 /DNA_ID=CAMNT_0024662019 /DNA_START=573 /DNA_END=911 /DNA_ORIENTATION=+
MTPACFFASPEITLTTNNDPNNKDKDKNNQHNQHNQPSPHQFTITHPPLTTKKAWPSISNTMFVTSWGWSALITETNPTTNTTHTTTKVLPFSIVNPNFSHPHLPARTQTIPL